jgi:hypothetical protein
MELSEADQRLWARQVALQGEARDVLADLDVHSLFADVGPVLAGGSYVSGLMVWRDLDVMVLARPDFAPRDVLRLLEHIVDLPGIVAFHYSDERGDRSPTGMVRDERYHLPITWRRAGVEWRIDLTV